MSDYLDLYDYRCRVAAMYRERMRTTLAGEDAATVLQRFREARDGLFAHHPQSALDEEQQRHFRGLNYFPYNPATCVEAELDTNVEPALLNVAMNAEETMTMTTVGRLHFSIEGQAVALSLYWLNIYGGGLFLPFRDASGPGESYGCQYPVHQDINASCSTLIMLIIRRVPTTIDGFARWLLLRIA